jgi:outer membrane protein insertion porin family
LAAGLRLAPALAALLALALALPAAAQEAVTVEEIVFEGNRRFAEANLEYSMRTKEGKPLDRDLLNQDIAMLHRYFDQVTLREEPLPGGVRLVFRVVENPLVSRVDFLGADALPAADLKALVDTRVGHPLAGYRLEHDRTLLVRKYRDAGYHWVEVKTEVLEDEGARRVIFRVVEGPFVEVDAIEFRGVRALAEGELRSVMALRPSPTFLSSTPFVERRLEEDRVAVLQACRDRGYLEAKVWIEGVAFDEDRDDATISVVVEEGEVWTVGEAVLEGGEAVPEKDRLRRALDRLRPGKPWLRRDFDRVRRDLLEELSRQGFADARVEVVPVPRDAGRVQDARFAIREGRKFRIRSIDVAGNGLTRDKVILREFTVAPGDPLDSNAIAKAVRRVLDTRYFSSAIPVYRAADDPGEKDVEIRVEEASSTRRLIVGLGVSSDTGLGGTFAVEWRNFDAADLPGRLDDLLEGLAFTGAGQTLELVLRPGTEISQYRLAFTEPWILDRRVLGGIDLYASEDRRFAYDEDRSGVELRAEKRWLVVGEDLDQVWSAGLRPKFEGLELSGIDRDAPPNAFVLEGNHQIRSLTLALGWRRIDRDDATERGFRAGLQSELAGGPLGGDFDFWKNTLEASRVLTLWRDDDERAHTLTFRVGGGLGMSLEDGAKVPLVERLMAGGSSGPGAVRGFSFSGVGPHGRGNPARNPWRVLRSIERNKGEPMGGDAMATGSIEYGFPLFADVLRGAFFADAGNNAFNTGDLRHDWRVAAGFGISLRVPIFPIPLRFDFGWPIHAEDGDDERILSFEIDLYF